MSNNKEFLLGELYDKITNEIYEEKMQQASEFEKLMDNYLNEIYENVASKVIQWNLYKQHILYYEKALEKYLYMFNIEELNNLIMAIPTASSDIKDSVFSLCSQYLDWCIYKNLISINNMEALDRSALVVVSKKAARGKIVAGDKFYDMLTELEKYTSPQNYISLLLTKIGLFGEDLIEIRDAKYSNIDRENMLFRVINEETGEVIKELKITERDLNLIDKAVNEKNNIYKETGRIIKTTSINATSGDILTESALYSRANNAFKAAGIKRVSFNDIYRSAKIEKLLEIRKNKLITTNDIYEVSKYFNPTISRSACNSLKKLYENVVGQEVILSHKSKENYEVDGTEFVKKIQKELGIIRE